jgi:ATP-dependent DNA helicase RecG
MPMSDEMLRTLIANGEGDKVEFKQSTASMDGIGKAVCAQANNLSKGEGPGFVLVGVADDGQVVGIDASDSEQQRLAQVRLDGKTQPTPNMTLHILQLDGKNVAILEVTPSSSPPVRCGGISYVRIGTATGKATPDEERQLVEHRRGIALPYDTRGLAGSSQNDLDIFRFQIEYLPQAVSASVLAENGRSVEEQLASLKLTDVTGEATPTGLLAVGKNSGSWLPGAYVQFRRVAGTGITDETLDQAEFHGALLDVARETEAKLRAHNTSALSITPGRHEIKDAYPINALEQIFRNALMHRDYEIISPVRVTWFSDRIQIDNPGGPFGISPANFGRPGFTAYRNPNIAEMMKSVGLAERFGVGLEIARKGLAAGGHPALELKTEGNFTFSVIWGIP